MTRSSRTRWRSRRLASASAASDLRKLIEVKRAAGRPKDLEAVAELEALLDESGG